MTYEISHRHLPPLRCSDLVKGAARRYVHRHADRRTWTEWRERQIDLLDELAAADIDAAWFDDDREIVGCGPHTCRAGVPR